MKRRWMAVGVVALVVGLMASTALVQEGEARKDRPPGGGRGDRGGMWGRGGGGGGALPDYTAGIRDLNQDQRRQISEIRRATLEKVRQLEQQMNEQIKRLLTAEQLKAMETAQKQATHRGPDGVIMTDEQKRIMDEAREAAGKVESREERAKIMSEATEKVRASYTDEQKKQAEENRARFQRGGAAGGRKGGGSKGGGQE